MNQFPYEQLSGLVNSYSDAGVTDQLLAFGNMLVSEIERRDERIESKATSTLGWATAILAFLFTQGERLKSPSVAIITGIAAAGAVLAVICSFMAVRARAGWNWPSDQDWFQSAKFGSADELKRFHLLSLRDTWLSHKRITTRKGLWMLAGQAALAFAAVMLAVGVAGLIFSSPALRS